jgi:hypothetical protein
LSIADLFASQAAAAVKLPGLPSPAGPTDLNQILRHRSVVEVTPALAERILRECRCEYQVPPRKWHVDFLAAKIKDGQLWTRPLSFALVEGRLILINGWDRLAAVSRSGIAVRFPVRVTSVGSQEELRSLAFSPAASRLAPEAEKRITPPPAQQHPAVLVAPGQPAPAVAPVKDAPLDQFLKDGTRVFVTPELARRINAECRYEHERPLREDRLAQHIRDMAADRFFQGSLLAFGSLNGKLIRVDGQHRTEAVIESGKGQSFLIAVHPVENEKELAQLYSIFDAASSVRTPVESASWLLPKTGLSKRELAVLFRTVPFLQAGFHLPQSRQAAKMMQSSAERNAIALRWSPFAKRYFELIAPVPRAVKDALHCQSVAAVALMTLKFHTQHAAQFWGPIARLAEEDMGLDRNDPRRALYKRLQVREKSIPMQLHVAAAAWNAFHEGRRMKEIRVNPDRPFTIAGTPIVEVHLEGDDDAAERSN